MDSKSTRRDFLKRAAIGGVAMAGFPGVIGKHGYADDATPGKTRMVVARDTSMFADGEANQAAIEQVLGRAMTRLTNSSSAEDAWKSLFKLDDVVGIKANCLFGRGVSTRPEVVSPIIAGLQLAGVKPENIIVWDRASGDLTKCGFTVNKEGPGVLYWADDGDWGSEIKNGSFNGQISKIFERITALINAPIVKHHGITGLSGALKNHYGSINNAGQHHGNNADPYLADLNMIPQIKDKTRLIVADALRPQADKGPRQNAEMQWDYHTLIVGTDPLAVDVYSLDILEAQRKEVELAPMIDQRKWIASSVERGIGTDDPSKIELIRI